MIPFKASVQWSVTCARCYDRTTLNTFDVCLGSVVPLPTLTDGWRVLDGLVLCPRHTVRIEDRKRPHHGA
jgi:hypothetical protein